MSLDMSTTKHASVKPAVARHRDLTIAEGYEQLLVANGLDSLDALFDLPDAESLSKPGLDAWRERFRLTLGTGGERRTFYLKRFRDPPPSARRDVQRSGTGASSLAGLEWAWMKRLAADGIECVEPVAFGERLCGGKETRSAILTLAVPGESLECWVGRWGAGDRATIGSLIPTLAAFVARLHERGYVHRDLYLSHIFYDPTRRPETSLHLIDLQRVMRPRRLHRRWIIKDLAALNFSTPRSLVLNTDRLRWLTHYLGASKLDRSARRLVYRIIGKTRKIARHEEHRTERWRKRSEDS